MPTVVLPVDAQEPLRGASDEVVAARTLHGVLGDSARNDDSPFRAEDFAKDFKDTVDSVGACTAATPLYDVPRRVA